MPISESFIVSSCRPRTALKAGNFVERLFEDFDSFPINKTAILDDASGRRLTFTDLKRITMQVASGLVKRGFGKGDVLCLFGSNCLENAPITFGAALTGGAVHMVKPPVKHKELRFHFDLATPKIVVTTADYVQRVLEAIRAMTAKVQDIYVIGAAVDGCRDAEELLEDPGDANPWGGVEINPQEDVALMLQTGGTTSIAKTCMLTHEGWQLTFLEAPPLEPEADHEELTLGYMPFNFTLSMFIIYGRWLNQGCGVVNVNTDDPEAQLRLIEKYKVTRLALTPITMNALEKCPYFERADLSSLRRIISGGAAMSKVSEQKLSASFLKRAPKVVFDQSYGMTEVGGSVTAFHDSTDLNYKRKFGSSGLIYPSTELRVISCDLQRRPCGPGELGEIVLRTLRLMKGYLKNDAATRKVVVDGWYHSGDYGYFDEEGYIYVLDRVDDLIRHNEGLIVPSYVEGILRCHPSIRDCAVVGRTKDVGPEAMAFVVATDGSDLSEEEVLNFAAEKLEPHEQLTGGVHFVSRIPKSSAGKTLRRMLIRNLQERELS